VETVTEYRERAEECRLMANRALPKHRNALLKMAQVWEILAHDRRKKLLRRCPNNARTSQTSGLGDDAENLLFLFGKPLM
jgi:hypothetical protein